MINRPTTPPAASATAMLFDDTAHTFARTIDASIAAGLYARGALFVSLASRYIPGSGKILDFGCGPGRISDALALSGYEVVGVDPSPQMIKEANSLDTSHSGARFHVLSEAPDILSPNQWDGIVCSSVIEYVEHPGDTLRSFFSSLKPGGVVIVSYANAISLWRKYARMRAHRYPHLKVQWNLWTWRQARACFRDAGFEILYGPKFFESPFDKYGALKTLSKLSPIGTLAIVVLGKNP